MISCKEYAQVMKETLRKRIETMDKKPALSIIQVGDDQASDAYIRGKIKDCEEVGIRYIVQKLSENVSEENLLYNIELASCVADGIIVQLPLPRHINVTHVKNAIPKEKDVDGFRRDSLFECCTPKGIIDWLDFNEYELCGKNAVVLGRSEIVGKPLVNMLIDRGATVTCCNSHTDYGYETQITNNDADVIVSAIGKAKFLDWADIGSDCEIVIDVGINRDDAGKLCGDVNRESVEKLRPDTYVTPVPGGVGLLTRVSLLKNVVEAHENGYTENAVEDAISLLRKNDYFVRKIPKNLCETAKGCSETGCGECLDCSCFACMIGNE